jgi:fatty-acyl-CoA synthase
MNDDGGARAPKPLSIVHGPPLSAEPWLGALTIPGYLREVTTRFGEREALVHRSANGIERWNYTTLWERSVEAARALAACGVGKDSRVGILMTNRPEFLSALFGTALAGGVAVALNTFSTPLELEHLIRQSGISILLFEHRVAAKEFTAILGALEPAIAAAEPGRLLSCKFPFLHRLVAVGNETDAAGGAVETWAGFIRRGDATPRALIDATSAAAAPADTGMLFFSSGTTSMPKGILHAHRAVAVQWWRWPWNYSVADDVRCWTANGFFWSGNCSLVIGVALSSGGCIVLQSTFQAEAALELMQAERVTLPVARPHQWAQIEAAANFGRVDLGSLRYVGEDTAARKHPTVRTNWHMPVSFGTTETLTIITSFPAATPVETMAGSYGTPLPGNTLKIVDPITGAVVQLGDRGEIAIKGPTLMLGYLGRTDEESFDPEGYYRTGDGGYVDASGRLFWEGRLSDIIKTGGANVSPIEIDEVIRTYPGVKIVQTIGVPHDTLGEMVVACIVPHDGAVLVESDVREFVREKLSSYKVPRRVLILREDELSITGSAKVKAGALRELAARKLGAAGATSSQPA